MIVTNIQKINTELEKALVKSEITRKKIKKILDNSLPNTLSFLKEKNIVNKYFLKFLINIADSDLLPRIIWDNHFNFIYGNNKFLEKLKYTNNELQNKYILSSELMTEESIIASKKIVINNMKHGTLWTDYLDNEWFDKDGNIIKCRWLTGINDENNGIGTAQCVFL